MVVFRKESKVDAFQRQISALRQQLGNEDASGESGVYVDPNAGDSREEYPAAQAADAGQMTTDPSAEQGGYEMQQAGGYSFGGFGAPTPAGQATAGVTGAELVPEPPPLPDTPVVDAQVSVIAHDTAWKGEFESQGSLHVHGRIEGSIKAKDNVYVAEEADVDATIAASNVVVAGLVKGSIRCGTRFEVLPQGRVGGDVQAPTLVIHEGATITGQFRMGAAGQAEELKQPAVVQRRAARSGA